MLGLRNCQCIIKSTLPSQSAQVLEAVVGRSLDIGPNYRAGPYFFGFGIRRPAKNLNIWRQE